MKFTLTLLLMVLCCVGVVQAQNPNGCGNGAAPDFSCYKPDPVNQPYCLVCSWTDPIWGWESEECYCHQSPPNPVPPPATASMNIMSHMHAKTMLVGLPDHSVTLSGNPHNPTIANNTGKKILLVTLLTHYEGEVPVAHPREDPIEAGATFTRNNYMTRTSPPVKAGGTGLPLRVLSVSVDSVVFEDGQFVGPDESAQIDRLRRHFAGKKIGVNR